MFCSIFTSSGGGDEFLRNQLEHAIDMIEPIGGDAYRTLRDAFDAYMQPREYLFENLMVYDIHRHFLAHSQDATVLTGVKFSVVSFAVIRCMAARLYRDTGFPYRRSLCGTMPTLVQMRRRVPKDSQGIGSAAGNRSAVHTGRIASAMLVAVKYHIKMAPQSHGQFHPVLGVSL